MRHVIQLELPSPCSKEYLIDCLALLPDGAIIQSIDHRFDINCSVTVVAHPDFPEVSDYVSGPYAQIMVEKVKFPFAEETFHPVKLVIPEKAREVMPK